MTTYYGLRCRECKEDKVLYIGQYAAQEWLASISDFQAVYKAVNRCKVPLRLTADWCHEAADFDSVLKFSSRHNGHDVCVVNEYGEEF